MTWGETNHNNHHARAISANHGMFKGQLDPSANLLRFLEKRKLVWNVQWTRHCDGRRASEEHADDERRAQGRGPAQASREADQNN